MDRLEWGLGLEVVGFSFKAVSPLGETTNGKGYQIQEAF
jgi:hypothetical protein